jgi:hypothetical protein
MGHFLYVMRCEVEAFTAELDWRHNVEIEKLKSDFENDGFEYKARVLDNVNC